MFGESKDYGNWTPEKTFLGSDKKDRRGVILHTFEYLLEKRKKLKGEKIITITCSFYEIYLNQVRDLGRNYSCKFEDPDEIDHDN